MTTAERGILDDQIDYYRTRAGEYDEWFERTGRFDRGEAHRKAWFSEAAQVETALRESAGGKCLELACGTGLWTRHLAKLCDSVTALDASPEVIAINCERVGASNVAYAQADLFNWQPEETYDFVFFSFWLSHVPAERFAPFWEAVGKALAPGGKVFVLDSLHNAASTATDHEAPGTGGVVTRKLNDGKSFQIVKVFYTPQDLATRLDALGWDASFRSSGEFFIYGEAARAG